MFLVGKFRLIVDYAQIRRHDSFVRPAQKKARSETPKEKEDDTKLKFISCRKDTKPLFTTFSILQLFVTLLFKAVEKRS